MCLFEIRKELNPKENLKRGDILSLIINDWKNVENAIRYAILFRNFDVFSQSEKSIGNFKSLIFQLALKGRLDLQKLSEGRIKKPLQALVKEQKQIS